MHYSIRKTQITLRFRHLRHYILSVWVSVSLKGTIYITIIMQALKLFCTILNLHRIYITIEVAEFAWCTHVYSSAQNCVVPWVRVHSACTSHSLCRWRSPGGVAGSPCLRWRPCSHCKSRWGLPGCPWSCSCSWGTLASSAFALSAAGKRKVPIC